MTTDDFRDITFDEAKRVCRAVIISAHNDLKLRISRGGRTARSASGRRCGSSSTTPRATSTGWRRAWGFTRARRGERPGRRSAPRTRSSGSTRTTSIGASHPPWCQRRRMPRGTGRSISSPQVCPCPGGYTATMSIDEVNVLAIEGGSDEPTNRAFVPRGQRPWIDSDLCLGDRPEGLAGRAGPLGKGGSCRGGPLPPGKTRDLFATQGLAAPQHALETT
jgi:hypothetical protein